ncbi:AHH domain-containing protein [Bacillus sp. FSL H8-0547]
MSYKVFKLIYLFPVTVTFLTPLTFPTASVAVTTSSMINPHAHHTHHILFKKGLGETQQKLVQEGQEILKRYGIDPIICKENLVWAPNSVIGQHSLDSLEKVVNRLKTVEEMGGDIDDIVEALDDLGDIASTR